VVCACEEGVCVYVYGDVCGRRVCVCSGDVCEEEVCEEGMCVCVCVCVCVCMCMWRELTSLVHRNMCGV